MIDKTHWGMTWTNNVTYLSDANAYEKILHRWGDNFFQSWEADTGETQEEKLNKAKAEFLGVWNAYKQEELESWLKIEQLLTLVKFPKEIEKTLTKEGSEQNSKNGEREIAFAGKQWDTDTGSEELAKHKGSKRSFDNYRESTSPGATMKTTEYYNGFDSESAKEKGYVITGRDGEGTNDLTKSGAELHQDIDANTFDKDVKSFNNRKTEHEDDRTQTETFTDLIDLKEYIDRVDTEHFEGWENADEIKKFIDTQLIPIIDLFYGRFFRKYTYFMEVIG